MIRFRIIQIRMIRFQVIRTGDCGTLGSFLFCSLALLLICSAHNSRTRSRTRSRTNGAQVAHKSRTKSHTSRAQVAQSSHTACIKAARKGRELCRNSDKKTSVLQMHCLLVHCGAQMLVPSAHFRTCSRTSTPHQPHLKHLTGCALKLDSHSLDQKYTKCYDIPIRAHKSFPPVAPEPLPQGHVHLD